MELSKRLIPACLLLAFWAGTSPVRAQEPVPAAGIHNLKASFKQEVLRVSYTVEGAFTPAVQERLVSASTIRFVHRIRVYRRRPLFFGGRVLAERNIETSVRYDNLTRQYALTRIVDGAPVESTTTESEQEMRRFMTEIEEFDDEAPPVNRVVVAAEVTATATPQNVTAEIAAAMRARREALAPTPPAFQTEGARRFAEALAQANRGRQ